MKSIKTIFIAVVIVGIIGLKVYNAVPRYKEEVNDSQTIPADQAYTYSYEIESEVEFKISIKEINGKPIDVYWLNDADHLELESENVSDKLLKRIEANTLISNSPDTKNKIFRLGSKPGRYYIYIESSFKSEDTDPRNFKIQLWAKS
jgi:hypothetical protein